MMTKGTMMIVMMKTMRVIIIIIIIIIVIVIVNIVIIIIMIIIIIMVTSSYDASSNMLFSVSSLVVKQFAVMYPSFALSWSTFQMLTSHSVMDLLLKLKRTLFP